MNAYILSILLVCLFEIGSALQCYECNVWKAGYGQLCSQPRIRDDCKVCMKVETIVYMGYYKNTPRKSTTVSKICAKSNTVHFSNECHKYDTSDGTSERCYCDTDRCNGASTFQSNTYISLTIAFTLILFARKLA